MRELLLGSKAFGSVVRERVKGAGEDTVRPQRACPQRAHQRGRDHSSGYHHSYSCFPAHSNTTEHTHHAALSREHVYPVTILLSTQSATNRLLVSTCASHRLTESPSQLVFTLVSLLMTSHHLLIIIQPRTKPDGHPRVPWLRSACQSHRGPDEPQRPFAAPSVASPPSTCNRVSNCDVCTKRSLHPLCSQCQKAHTRLRL